MLLAQRTRVSLLVVVTGLTQQAAVRSRGRNAGKVSMLGSIGRDKEQGATLLHKKAICCSVSLLLLLQGGGGWVGPAIGFRRTGEAPKDAASTHSLSHQLNYIGFKAGRGAVPTSTDLPLPPPIVVLEDETSGQSRAHSVRLE